MIRDDRTLYTEDELIEQGLDRELIWDACEKGLINPRRPGTSAYQYIGSEVTQAVIELSPACPVKSKQERRKEFAATETCSAPPQGRKQRGIPIPSLSKPLHLQFSLRTALVMMTLAGVLISGSILLHRMYFAPTKTLDGAQSIAIVQGMTPLQVRWAVGPPYIAVRANGRDTSWTYKYEAGTIGGMGGGGSCQVYFGADGKVQATSVTGMGGMGGISGMGGGFM